MTPDTFVFPAAVGPAAITSGYGSVALAVRFQRARFYFCERAGVAFLDGNRHDG